MGLGFSAYQVYGLRALGQDLGIVASDPGGFSSRRSCQWGRQDFLGIEIPVVVLKLPGRREADPKKRKCTQVVIAIRPFNDSEENHKPYKASNPSHPTS